MKDVIDNIDSIIKITADKCILDVEFKEMGIEWENGDGYSYNCTPIAEKELKLVLEKAENYKGFNCNYDESDYSNTQYDEWYEDQGFSEQDFWSCNVTEENYGKADAVAFDIKSELVEYIDAEIDRQVSKDDLLTALISIIRADERYQTKCEVLAYSPKDLSELCEITNINTRKSDKALEITAEMIQYLCNKIKQ